MSSCSIALVTLATIALTIGCDDSSGAPASVPVGSPMLDGGTRGGGDNDGGSSLPGPAPGPAVTMALPHAYAFITTRANRPSSFASSGFTWRYATLPDGTLSELDRSLVWVQANASATGRPGAIPVRFRGFYKGQPTTSFMCAVERAGGSGRAYLTLDDVGADPATGEPASSTQWTCDWFLVRRSDAGANRYQLLVVRNGTDLFVGTDESDVNSGYRVAVGGVGAQHVVWQMVSSDEDGRPLPP